MSRREHTGIIELPDGRCKIDYYDAEGGRHRELIGSKKLAIAVFRQRKLEILEGRHRPPQRVRLTFKELAAKAMVVLQSRLKPLSYHNDDLRWKVLNELMGHVLIDQITGATIETVLAQIRAGRGGSDGKPRGPATTNRYRSLLSNICAYAIRAGHLQSNPVHQVKRFQEPKGRVRYLSPDEEPLLRRTIRESSVKRGAQRVAEFNLALFAGFRKGEVYNAQWKDVDLENPNGPMMRVDGKTGPRTMQLHPAAVRAIQVLYERSFGDSYVVRTDGTKGRSKTGVDSRKWFKKCVERAGIEDFRWHDLRHTFASRAIMAGVPVVTVMEWLGHTSLAMTKRYLHLAPNHKREELAKIIDTTEDYSQTDRTEVTEIKQVTK